ncbi:hypothetical protein DFA_12015 [Cavenderia fasciculata]|uniref:Uncharacterized protein n=1 Tax=Cavenderia fasciculata TaxID=261658 RepID=F4QF91_CACFS|nr:uncharacterized protein DFA_12015 [Cavenderia fasciculata]EGG14245.1 hypothetical protein DFA_12015 [Cavenderia fasciculata]|eukprot:XP_004350954.1 hypothetical protein DFA_12015 [Cavenderia fasciculata]
MKGEAGRGPLYRQVTDRFIDPQPLFLIVKNRSVGLRPAELSQSKMREHLANLSQIQTGGYSSSATNNTSTNSTNTNGFNFQDAFTTQTSLGANKVAGDELV